MDFTKIWQFFKSLPTWSRIVALIAASALAFALSSCSRSSMCFKGQGEVEFVYKGTNGPSFSSKE